MTQTPVSSLIPRLAVPTIISMLVSSIYNMADTYFVSQIGTSASGAVGVVFSIMAIIQAVGFTIGMGGGILASRALGAKDKDRADTLVTMSFLFSLLFGVILAFLGIVFNKGLMRMLGATETILPYAEAYSRYIFLAAPFMIGSYVMNNVLRSEGKAFYAMIGITTGGILNIALDPLFIFVFGLGTAGAAIATAISQLISFIILLMAFVTGKSEADIALKTIKDFKPSMLIAIIKTGLPSLARQGLASIATILLNLSAGPYGDAAIAAMSITGKVTFFIFSALLGFGQGFQPVCSYNWGAGKYERVRKATVFTAQIGTAIISILSLFTYIFAPAIIKAFISDDPMVLEVGRRALRAQCLLLPFCGINVTTNMALQGTSHVASATFLAMCRQGIFYIPSILILPRILGITGVEIAQPAADVLTFTFSIFLFVSFLKECKEKSKLGNIA
ncbi:MAG: MATE family efflux transporter [Spirochaetales bacterium]|nr:MATE family efflux transporter [Spirochaetales bacterium]